MLTQVLIAILMIQMISSTCSKGCLRCSPSDICFFCDIEQSFILKNWGCEKIEISSCTLLSSEGKCLKCDRYYYLDDATMKCVKIADADLIPNCLIYPAKNACSTCAVGYYISQSKCVAITTKIDNCEEYLDAVSCHRCETGSILSENNKLCVNTSKVQNCTLYTFFECTECQEEYAIDDNYYFLKNYKFESAADRENLAALFRSQTQSLDVKGVKEQCFYRWINNCKSYQNALKCAICEDNCYLTKEYLCEPFPLKKIENCRSYSSYDVCEECEQGYVLKSGSICVSATRIDHCELYDGTETYLKCLKCTDSYYLNSNYCIKRTLAVDKCYKYNLNYDLCESCSDKYHVTYDGSKCLRAIDNCETYSIESNISSVDLLCVDCVDGFFVGDGGTSCVKGSVANCQTYDQTQINICLACNNQYYMAAANICQPHSIIKSCVLYDKTKKNTCNQCETGMVNFTLTTSCDTIKTLIMNCIAYSDRSTCRACAGGYYLSENKCLQIPLELNCVDYDGVQCLACKTNYAIFNKQCVEPPQYKTEGCASNNTQTLAYNSTKIQDFKCLSCDNNYLPYNTSNVYFCLNVATRFFTIENCAKYRNFNCSKCVDGYYLSNNTCVKSCTGSIKKASYGFSNDDSTIEILHRDICTANTSCMVEALNVVSIGGTMEDICVRCNTSMLTVIDLLDTDFSLTNSVMASALSPISVYPRLMCYDKGSFLVKGAPVSNMIDNCEYYTKLNDTTLGCVKCKHGYDGIVLNSESNTGYIDTCYRDTHCTSTYNEGIPLAYTKLLSCHFCQDTKQIPFIGVSAGSTLTYQPKIVAYKIEEYSWLNSTGDTAVQCLSPFFNAFFINASSKFNFPDFCGVGALNVNSARDASSSSTNLISGGDKTKMAVFCVACKPGYKASFFSQDVPAVVKCDPIVECLASTWFNNCSSCRSNYAYGYKTGFGIVYDVCELATSFPNCYAIKIDKLFSPYCVYCKKGYTLAASGLCEQMSVIRCPDGKFSLIKNLPLQEFGFLTYNFEDGFGVSECDQGYYIQKQSASEMVCIFSKFLNNLSANVSNFTIGCLNYSIINDIASCITCKIGYILTTSNMCIKAASLEGCTLAIDSTHCQTCANEYSSYRNFCYKGKIENCATYSDNITEQEQVCYSCNDGYYPIDKVCRKGNVTGCAAYRRRNDGSCRLCESGYAIITLAAVTYCYPLHSESKCETTNDKMVAQKFTCSACKSDSFLVTYGQSEFTDICLPFNKIEKCVEYNLGSTLLASTLGCKVCEPEYFVQYAVCVPRTIIHASCSTYAFADDRCNACAAGFMVDTEIGCRKNPDGMEGCRLYADAKTCTGCESQMYVADNTCNKIESSNRVSNCNYYLDVSTCSECNQGYFLESNTCVMSIAQQCRTQSDKLTCNSCEDGYGFKTADSVIDCVPVEISRCVSHEMKYPFRCKVCETMFYPNSDGLCVSVNTRIGNCLYYESNNVCSKCLKGFVLNEDQSACEMDYIQFLDPNCNSYKKLRSPICAQCHYSYSFKQGKCLSCVDNSISDGCFSCNPYNEKECLLCRSFYYMNKEGKCITTLTGNDSGNENNSQFTTRAIATLFIILITLM